MTPKTDLKEVVDSEIKYAPALPVVGDRDIDW